METQNGTPPTIAEQFYDAYNAGGSDPAFVNKNFRGDPCPAWAALPQNVREKWEAVALAASKVEYA